MEIKDLIKVMMKTFFIATTGIVVSAAVFCSVFSKGTTLGVSILWQILILAGLTTLPSLLMYSPRELTKRALLVRQVLHMILLVIILFYLGYRWDWITISKPMQWVLYLFLIAVVYLAVKVLAFQKDKKLADQLNTGLKKYQDI